MKKLMSILICVAIILSFIPAVAATGAGTVEQEFVITTAGQTENCGWEVVSSYVGSGSLSPNLEAEGYKQIYRTLWFNQTQEYRTAYVMFRIKVNVAGTYTLQIKGAPDSEENEVFKMGVFWLKDNGKEIEATAGKTDTTTNSAFDLVDGSERSNSKALVGSCDFDDAKLGYQDVAEVTVDEPGDYLIAFFGTKDTTATNYIPPNKREDSSPIVYLSGIKLVPVSAEEPEDEPAEGTVNFAVTTNIPGETVTRIESLTRGQSVNMTQYLSNNPNYKFIGWMRGAYTEESAQSESAWVTVGDTYNVWTNTFLTAVYEKEDDKNVAFWNQNGAYIGSMTESVYNEQTELFTPKLTGFGTFLGWFTDGNKPFTAGQTLADGTTNAVAQYTASAVTAVTHNGDPVADADTYNAPVELNKTNANTAWLRDGEPVAYGTTYKFNVWDATNITEGTEKITEKVPVAVLDYSNVHKAYMLEYDAGDYEIVEAGIIFGKDTPSIKTYTSQRKEKHNQFTVPEEGTLEATGYIIYTLDKGTSYKTKYVSVKPEE